MSVPRQTIDEIIDAYSLEPHPEGGYFALTHVADDQRLFSSIYYLLAPRPEHVVKQDTERVGQGEFAVYKTDLDSNGQEQNEVKWSPHSAVFHLNRSATMHLHHAGRAKYTLIEAYPAPGRPPKIKEVVVGTDAEQGEVRQLLVEGGDQGWWKKSEVLLPEHGDLETLDEAGALISEIVMPAFDWKDHKFLRQSDLQSLFGDDQDSIRRFQACAAADSGSRNA